MTTPKQLGSPHKTARSAKDYFDSSEDEHSGKESPFRPSARKLKVKTPKSAARIQRAFKTSNQVTIPLPAAASVTSKAPSPTRESPRRTARRHIDYSQVESSDENAEDVLGDCDWDSPASLSTEDDGDFEPRCGKKVTQSTYSRRPLGSLASLNNATHHGPRPPTLFDDSDTENRPSSNLWPRLSPIKQAQAKLAPSRGIATAAAAATDVSSNAEKRPKTPQKGHSQSFSSSPSKIRLASPTKASINIPTPPSNDFWDQGQMTDWTEKHSPRKQMKFSPKKPPVCDSINSFKASEVTDIGLATSKVSINESASELKAQTPSFNRRKHEIATEFLHLLDDQVADGEVGRLCQETGGVSLVWSKKLNSTAGRANWKREAIKQRDESTKIMATEGYRNVASIELAEKVIDNEERLYNVLAHEYCHLANFMISRVVNNPHGASFKEWAAKTTALFQVTHQVNVTTKHDYEISYRYIWICRGESCRTQYQRHSKSIDPTRHTCGKCGDALDQVKPKPRARVGGGQNALPSAGGASEYNKFVKDHFQEVKRGLPPGSPMKEVMSEIGSRYRAAKAAKLAEPRQEVEADIPATADGLDSADEGLGGIVRKLDFLNI